MTIQTTPQPPKPAPAARQPIRGFSPQAVAVFCLGLAGALTPFVGVIPSVVALVKARGARREISRSRGHYRGGGLISWGVGLSWLGILGALLSVTMALFLMWAVQNSPALLPTLLGMPDVSTAIDSHALLSFLDSQDLKSLLSDPAILNELEQRLREAGVEPQTLFVDPSATPKP